MKRMLPTDEELKHILRDITRLMLLLGVFVASLMGQVGNNAKRFMVGRVVAIVPEAPHPLGSPPVSMYQVDIQAGNLIYEGECLKSICENKWKTNENVEFRVDHKSLFLKQHDGKAVRLAFVTSFTPSGKPEP